MGVRFLLQARIHRKFPCLGVGSQCKEEKLIQVLQPFS
jgi:hypothetical protein